jgi:glycosyltransferase involved in cell wall biosynthesis
MSAAISLILPNYNRDRYLADAINSILAQTYAHFELLIWDDGSTDSSLDIAHDFAQRDDRIRVHAASHRGIAPTLKAAIAQTTFPYLGWVDSDDKLAPTALAETVAILNKLPQVGMVYTQYTVIDEGGNTQGLGDRCRISYSKERLLIDFMTFHFRLMRRSVYEQVGGIDDSFQWAEDYDLCLKISEVTQIYHLPKPLYFYRRHSSNLTNQQYETIRWAEKAIQQAMVRRGLNQTHQLEVQIVGQFRLLPKSDEVQSRATAPLVSVIIPTHNRLPLLGRALRSVQGQTYRPVEIIVIDDGSTDGTTEWVQTHYPQVQVITLPRNGGAAAARNEGAAAAKGQFLAFLDSDDQWHPHYLQHQINTLLRHPGAVLIYCNYVYSFGEDQRDTRVTLPAQQADPIAALLRECFIHTLSQVVVSKDNFQQVGGFNPQLRSCHDWDFYLRLFKLGSPVHCSDFLVRKYWLPNSLVTQAQGQIWLENGLRVLDLFYERPDNDRYAPLRVIAEQKLRDHIDRSQPWFTQGFRATTNPIMGRKNAPLINK